METVERLAGGCSCAAPYLEIFLSSLFPTVFVLSGDDLGKCFLKAFQQLSTMWGGGGVLNEIDRSNGWMSSFINLRNLLATTALFVIRFVWVSVGTVNECGRD